MKTPVLHLLCILLLRIFLHTFILPRILIPLLLHIFPSSSSHSSFFLLLVCRVFLLCLLRLHVLVHILLLHVLLLCILQLHILHPHVLLCFLLCTLSYSVRSVSNLKLF